MSKQDWLENLKVGDSVVVKCYDINRWTKRVRKVIAIDTNIIVDVDGIHRKFNKNGYEVTRDYNKYTLEECYPVKQYQIERQELIEKIVRFNYSSITKDVLENVLEILKKNVN